MRQTKYLGAVLAVTLLPAGILTAQNEVIRDPLPVPDIPGFRTLKGDFHTHTVFSDGEVWPTFRAWEAWRDGLDVLAMTDHADSHPNAPDVSSDLSRPYAIARALAEQLGLILIQGVELGHGATHWNALFVTDPNALQGRLELREALRRARAQEAFVFWNHPGAAPWSPEIASYRDENLFQGIELVNGSRANLGVFPWGEEKGLTFLANSDIHGASSTRKRAITLIFARTADAAGVKEALFARRTAAWVGSDVYGPEEMLRGLWENAVKAENPELTWNFKGRFPRLLVSNHCAIPFQFKFRRMKLLGSGNQDQGWVASYPGELHAERVSPVHISITSKAPPGEHNLEMELEVTNLHAGPGKHPVVHLPFRLKIER